MVVDQPTEILFIFINSIPGLFHACVLSLPSLTRNRHACLGF